MNSQSLWRGFLGLLLLVCAGCSAGCSATVRPTVAESEFLSGEPKVLGGVVLVSSEGFRGYTSKQTDVMDMKSWSLELGPAAADAFRYKLSSRFEKADVLAAAPAYPVGPEVKAVMVPVFAEVKSTQPVVFKFESYSVTVTFAVDVFDGTGRKVYSHSYTGFGKQSGSIGYESAGHAALPVASRQAIHDAVDRAVGDLVVYVNTGAAPTEIPKS